MKPCGQTVLRELFGMAEAVPSLSAALAGKTERIQRDRKIARLGGLFAADREDSPNGCRGGTNRLKRGLE